MSAVLNNQIAPDPSASLAASTLDNLPNPQRLNIDVSNSAIYWQVKQVTSPTPIASEGTWQQPVFMYPGSRSLFRSGIRGFRFWAAVAAASLPAGQQQARVTVEAEF